MTTLSEHITVSQRFLAHAQEQLQVGDLPQASEKGWGASAHYLKAVAKQRGWTNNSHRDFFIVKDRLAEETNNPNEIKILFGVLRGLHQNFYEPLYTREDVRIGLDAAKEFIDRLEQAGALRNQ